MSARNTYTRSMRGWYRTNPWFTRYMLREGTSVLFAIYALVLLAGITALAKGETAWGNWVDFVSGTPSVLVHILVLAAALYHSVTWFKVSPKAAPPLFIGGKRVPDAIIIGSQSAGLVVATLAIVGLFASASW